MKTTLALAVLVAALAADNASPAPSGVRVRISNEMTAFYIEGYVSFAKLDHTPSEACERIVDHPACGTRAARPARVHPAVRRELLVPRPAREAMLGGRATRADGDVSPARPGLLDHGSWLTQR
jgi:hypothetical protein